MTEFQAGRHFTKWKPVLYKSSRSLTKEPMIKTLYPAMTDYITEGITIALML